MPTVLNKFVPGPCRCCGGCRPSFVVTDNCAGTPVEGALVTITNTANTITYSSGTTNSSGYVQLTIPAAGNFRVVALKDCANIAVTPVALTCTTSNYGLKAWQKANLGTQRLTIQGSRCKGGTWASEGGSATVGGQSVTIGPGSATGNLSGKVCGSVPVVWTGNPKYTATPSTLTYNPSCSTATGVINLNLKPGYTCCDFASDGIVSTKIMVADDHGSTVLSGGGINSTVCQGGWSHVANVDGVAPLGQYANGTLTCPAGGGLTGLAAQPVIAAQGDTLVEFSWASDGAGGYVATQRTPHNCHVWPTVDGTGKCQLPWNKQISRAAYQAGIDWSSYWKTWTSTGYTINSSTFPCSITFTWSQSASYPVTTGTNTLCDHGLPGPASTSLTITEMAP